MGGQGFGEFRLAGAGRTPEQDVDPGLMRRQRPAHDRGNRVQVRAEMGEVVPGQAGRGRGADDRMARIPRAARGNIAIDAAEQGEPAGGFDDDEPRTREASGFRQSLTDILQVQSGHAGDSGGRDGLHLEPRRFPGGGQGAQGFQRFQPAGVDQNPQDDGFQGGKAEQAGGNVDTPFQRVRFGGCLLQVQKSAQGVRDGGAVRGSFVVGQDRGIGREHRGYRKIDTAKKVPQPTGERLDGMHAALRRREGIRGAGQDDVPVAREVAFVGCWRRIGGLWRHCVSEAAEDGVVKGFPPGRKEVGRRLRQVNDRGGRGLCLARTISGFRDSQTRYRLRAMPDGL